jgi:glycosyltransferase involved in cell wall biosynthesis
MRLFEKGKVSVITPCYNGARFLDRYFDSLCNQTYDNIELIFVNDASSDASEKICLSWKSKIEERGYTFRYIAQKIRKGASSAINAGLPFVTGEFFIWPDCDDTLMPASIEKRADFLSLHPDYAMVRSSFVEVHEKNPDVISGYGSEWTADPNHDDIFDDLIFEKTFPMPGSYMVRSSVFFERVPSGKIYVNKGWGGQNWPILLPCSYKNKTGFIDEPLYKYFLHPDSVSHRIDKDIYSSHLKRSFNYQDILIHVIHDFDLLSENERNDYLARIDLKYIFRRLDLALKYNKLQDAKTEMQKLRNMHVPPGVSRKILYLICFFGVSGYIIRGVSLISVMYRKIRLNLHRV